MLLSATASTPQTSIAAPTSCCENGRPIMTDPHTGQTVCSCQYSSMLSAAYPRVAGLTADTVYGSAYATQGYVPFGADPSAFYSPLNGGSAATMGYPYDPTMAGYPYGAGYGGMDLNSAAHRKNATREATSTLKAWLYEHRKNPYPTKGEKIMLAIITKMTLTQVSTWFANARRRLKKENKMTWSPRNRCGDDDDDDIRDKLDSEGEEENNNDNNSSQTNENNSHDDEHKKDEDDDVIIDPANDKDDDNDSILSATKCDKNIHSPNMGKIPQPLGLLNGLTPPNNCSVSNLTSPRPNCAAITKSTDTSTKPRIWSLADIATSDAPSSGRRSPSSLQAHVTVSKPGAPYPSPMNSLRQWVADGVSPYSAVSHAGVLSHPYALAPPSMTAANHMSSTALSYSGTQLTSSSAALSSMPRFGVNSLAIPTSLYPHSQRQEIKPPMSSLDKLGHSQPGIKASLLHEEQKTAFKPVPKRSPLL